MYGVKITMTEQENLNLRAERLSLLIGTMIGQISELLNKISSQEVNKTYIFLALKDIHDAAGLQIHELYYKDKDK